ncbi:glycosyltransferase [Candidatus Bathyarchaeota archaeon]|nr:glycosyltransferase [Candidatus Bathyarchaeota archaeon]
MYEKPLVSVIVPTRNSAKTLEVCLISIKRQTYPNIELIIVDNYSKDETPKIARRYTNLVFTKGPERNIQRLLGASIAKGKYLLFIDSDMELPPTLIESAVKKCEYEGFDAVILPEVSLGSGFWADCRKLEKLCYLNDPYMEYANRFMKAKVYHAVGGYNPAFIGADDVDIHERIKNAGYRITRIQDTIKHHEVTSLIGLLRKSYVYGQDIPFFVAKYPKTGLKVYFPIRTAYLRNMKLFIKDPIHGLGLIFLKSSQFIVAGFGFFARVLRGWRYKEAT